MQSPIVRLALPSWHPPSRLHVFPWDRHGHANVERHADKAAAERCDTRVQPWHLGCSESPASQNCEAGAARSGRRLCARPCCVYAPSTHKKGVSPRTVFFLEQATAMTAAVGLALGPFRARSTRRWAWCSAHSVRAALEPRAHRQGPAPPSRIAPRESRLASRRTCL
jgi:hypothetical protein